MSYEKVHHDLAAVLQPNRGVCVYYDEFEPSRSTLTVGGYSAWLALFFGGFIFFGMGVGFLLNFWFAPAGGNDFAGGITVLS
ncbi:MAG: hypothetical protein QM775_29065 [Pirellulales bacterium]